MLKGILEQRGDNFYEKYEGIYRKIGSTCISKPISGHYIIIHSSHGNVDIAHNSQEALKKAHDYAIRDLSAQCLGGEIEDKTEFAKQNKLEQRTQPISRSDISYGYEPGNLF